MFYECRKHWESSMMRLCLDPVVHCCTWKVILPHCVSVWPRWPPSCRVRDLRAAAQDVQAVQRHAGRDHVGLRVPGQRVHEAAQRPPPPGQPHLRLEPQLQPHSAAPLCPPPPRGVTPPARPLRQTVPSTSSWRRPDRTPRTTERSCTTSWTPPWRRRWLQMGPWRRKSQK